MIEEKLTTETIRYIISRLIERANEAMAEKEKDQGDSFSAGYAKAYYQMVLLLQSKLHMTEQDLEILGLNMQLLKFCGQFKG